MKRRGFLHTAAGGMLIAPEMFAPEIGRAQGKKLPGEASTSKHRAAARVQAADGADLYCRAWGSGAPVVFVHGWAVNCDVWQYAMTSLSARNLCIAYDKRGHGRSSDPGHRYDYDTLADDLHAVLEEFDLRNAVLVGHSMGPAEIVRYLTRHGEARVSRLVLISSALPFMLKTPDNPEGIDPAMLESRRRQWVQDMPKFLADNARLFVGPESSPETVAWVTQMGMQASLKALIDLNHTITETDLRTEVAGIKLPTMIIHGAQDRSAQLELTGKKINAMIRGSRLKVYDGAPHGLLLTHQERLNSDILQWING